MRLRERLLVLTPVVQRWRARRDTYRWAGEPIQTRFYEVASIPDDNTAKAFVCAHHYSGSYPAARFRFGLHRGAELVGVAVFSQPCNQAVLRKAFGAAAPASTELGRLVLVDDVPANGESWFLARCFELLRRRGIDGVLSFSDPVPRCDQRGRHVFPGHIGTVYQASNAIYRGRTKRETKWLLPDGSVFEARSATKLRNGERGASTARKRLEAFGATPLGRRDDPVMWITAWRALICVPISHGGNHRYLFGLDRALRRSLPESLPYPKIEIAPRSA